MMVLLIPLSLMASATKLREPNSLNSSPLSIQTTLLNLVLLAEAMMSAVQCQKVSTLS